MGFESTQSQEAYVVQKYWFKNFWQVTLLIQSSSSQWLKVETYSTPKLYVIFDKLESETRLVYISQLNISLFIRYIERPLLIGNRKFDLRLYVLVTSYNPLTVYLHREGFARFSLSRYSMTNVRDPSNLSSHLTNVAVQKNLFGSDSTYRRTGGKWEIPEMKAYLYSKIGVERTN